MTKFFYSVSSLAAPHIGVLMDKMMACKNEGDIVFWAYCNQALTSCFKNMDGNECVCRFCHRMYNRFVEQYGEDLNIIPISRENFKKQERTFSYQNFQEVKAIVYRDVEIGNAILSLYLTFTRDLDLGNMPRFKAYFDPIAAEVCDFVDYAYQLIDEISPDEIIIFNGRLYENRLFHDIARVKNIKITSLEIVGGRTEPYKRICWENAFPHSISRKAQFVNDAWEKSKESDEEKRKIASTFYEKRRNGELIVDVKAYTKDQVKGLLPDDFDSKKRNVAIFNSSADELAALGGEWDANLLFGTQYETIEYILSHAPKDMHFYLRIHPNLAGIRYKYHRDLYKLDQYGNITIIDPLSKISSYALLDVCEKAIVFGSTMGVEACYWGKPAIIVGHSGYDDLDVCYSPKTKAELSEMVSGDLQPKDNLDAIKYAYFLLDRKYSIDPNKILDIDVKYKKLWHWDFTFTSYYKIWGSQYLFQFLYFVNCYLLPKITRKKNAFPHP